jgi:DNA recombination protein RmuC
LLAGQLAPIAAGVFLLGVVVSSGFWAWRLNVRARRAFEAGLNQQAEHNSAQQRLLDDRLEIRTRELERLHSRLELLEEQRQVTAAELSAKTGELAQRHANEAALEARLEESRKSFAEKEALFRESSELLKQEFELLANKIFERQGATHQERLASVLSPFKEQIVDFRKRIEEVYHTESKDRASLLGEVRNLQQASERINEEAENLTKALKGDVKVQGNWGEVVLERVLEESGLRAGHEYFPQTAQRSEAGDLKRPDVLIRLPDGKDVVVDAKMSLVAYEQALSAELEEQREVALRQHLSSIRAHIKRLSEQDYDRLKDIRSLDFVLLFIPIESAFTLAMQHDHRLFTEAFDKRIVIVSPTTLMMTLRIIHNVWRFEKQNRNAQEIAKRAGALYDKLRLLIEDMDLLGKQLGTVERTYDSAYAKLASGKGNLVRQVEQFRVLGAQIKKPLPKKLLEDAGAEVEEPEA